MLPPYVLFLAMQSRDKGASSWLNAIPLKDQGLALNNQQIRDSLRMRYNRPPNDIPSHCACGDRFSINHAITCKKGYLRLTGKNHSQKLATRKISIQSFRCDFKIQSGLRKQILFRSFDPVDVSFSKLVSSLRATYAMHKCFSIAIVVQNKIIAFLSHVFIPLKQSFFTVLINF
jgi:hypothetical protein